MLSALYAIASPSVCLSVRLSDTRMYYTKTVELRITNFSPYGSPITLVFADKFHPEFLTGPPEWGRQRREGGKTSHFLDLSVSISKTVGDTAKVTINDL